MLELYFLDLEARLKLKAKLEPLPPGPEELQQVLPQPQHVDAHNLVVVLRLKQPWTEINREFVISGRKAAKKIFSKWQCH